MVIEQQELTVNTPSISERRSRVTPRGPLPWAWKRFVSHADLKNWSVNPSNWNLENIPRSSSGIKASSGPLFSTASREMF